MHGCSTEIDPKTGKVTIIQVNTTSAPLMVGQQQPYVAMTEGQPQQMMMQPMGAAQVMQPMQVQATMVQPGQPIK